MTRNGVFDCLCQLILQDLPDDQTVVLVLEGIREFLIFGASTSRKEATNNKYLIKLKQGSIFNIIRKLLKESHDSESFELTFGTLNKYLKRHILRKKLRLKRMIVCFRNERHSLFGLFQNKKKKLCV